MQLVERYLAAPNVSFVAILTALSTAQLPVHRLELTMLSCLCVAAEPGIVGSHQHQKRNIRLSYYRVRIGPQTNS